MFFAIDWRLFVIKKYFLFLLLSWTFAGQTVITIDDTNYSDDFFFQKYSEEEWNTANQAHKSRIINDFIRRTVFSLEAKNLNLHLDPDVRIKLYNQRNRLLVNYAYENFVAKPLITDDLIKLTRENIKRDILVHHILIGFSGSLLQKQFDRTKDEAKDLAENLRQQILEGESFENLALKYSDDRSVQSNQGKLGWISWGETVHDFQLAAFSLNIGDVSRPVLTDYGYHIIYVSEERPSKYADVTDSAKLEKIINSIARRCVNNLLRPSAEEYDKKTIADHGVVFDEESLVKVFDSIDKARKKNKITGNPNLDIVSLFNNLDGDFIICVIDGKGFGIKWFADKLSRLPMSRRPQFDSVESLRSNFTIIVLQELAIKRGLENKLNEEDDFLNMYDEYETAILYDTYQKFLENNIAEPDSSSIKAYYEENKDIDFREGEKVSVREIKVNSQILADSLYSLLQEGENFIQLAEKYTSISPKQGGLRPPFTQGKYALMGEKAFSMNIGEISEPFENLDRTWSIIKLEEKLPEGYKPLNKVYNKIKTILKREEKNKTKENTFEKLKIKYNVTINPEFFSFENNELSDEERSN